MNIAFITLGYKPVRMSGLDISGERLVDGLLERGHEVLVIAAGKKEPDEYQNHPGLNIYRRPLGPTNWIGFSMRAARTLDRLESSRHFDVKHFWDVHFAYAYRGRYVATLHHSFKQRIKAKKGGLMRRFYYYLAEYLAEIPAVRRAEGLMAVSSATREVFTNQYRVSPSKIALTRHGIDTQFFKPIDDDTTLRKLRARLEIDYDSHIIMFAGFVTPRKGLEYLALAMRKIKPIPYLVITGKWSSSQRDTFLGLFGETRDRVIETGFVRDVDMPLYYSLADVYVSSSILEGFGLPIAEALACETPVVVAETGSVGEVVGPGGFLVPTRDPESLAVAISNLLQNKEKRTDLGKLGRQHIASNFSIEAMVSNTIEAYQRYALGNINS